MPDIEARVRADLEGARQHVKDIDANLIEMEKARVSFVSQRDQYQGVVDYCQHLLDGIRGEMQATTEMRPPAGAEEDARVQAKSEGEPGDNGGTESF